MKPDELATKLTQLAELVDWRGNPNFNELWKIAKDLDGIKLNIKHFGYELARNLAKSLPPRTVETPGRVGLVCKASTQADIESEWVAYWAAKIEAAVIYHRKLWELCYVLQALWENEFLQSGYRGLGFGCGVEPLPSLMTAMGIHVTITDLEPAEAAQKGWAHTNQHTATIDTCHRPGIVDRETFLRLANLEFVDMNAIPPHLTGFDFCWSICALEHLGSIANSMDFIENSLKTLRSGGLAVHTTEFNFGSDDKTIDNWATVLLQKKHFVEIAERLTAKGHRVAPLNFDIGKEPMDKFIDLPPFAYEYSSVLREHWSDGVSHLKLMIDGFPSTCFGMIILAR